MLPTFMEIFNGMNIELPLPTRILMKISYIFSHFWWVMILTVAFNILGAYALVFGHFGAPRMGLRGCAIASHSPSSLPRRRFTVFIDST